MRLLANSFIATALILGSCSDKAFKSAVYTDPAREKTHDKDNQTRQDLPELKTDGKKRSLRDHIGREKSTDDKSGSPTNSEASADSSADSTPTEDSDTYRSRRARNDERKKSGEPVNEESAENSPTSDREERNKERRKREESKKAEAQKKVGDLSFAFTSRSVHGTKYRSVLQILSGKGSELSNSTSAHFENLNNRLVTLELKKNENSSEFFTATLTLNLILDLNKGDESEEVERKVVLKDMDYMRKTASGAYQGKFKNSGYDFRLKVSEKDKNGRRSAELFHLVGGEEFKILDLESEGSH